ncbi:MULTISPECIES: hypothetical protein [Microbulbifer]|uniref:hypothetical protein n=1 Tax=Microbulbifer TaxID=48073 RepID=UPI000A8E436A|nr:MULTISPECIES: hypothetical protein [Microbulbifer]
MRNNLIPLLTLLLLITLLSWGSSVHYRPGSAEVERLCALDSYTLWLSACDVLAGSE